MVLAALDLSKAYNPGKSLVIQDLHDMHTPASSSALLLPFIDISQNQLIFFAPVKPVHNVVPSCVSRKWGKQTFHVCLREGLKKTGGKCDHFPSWPPEIVHLVFNLELLAMCEVRSGHKVWFGAFLRLRMGF